MTTQTIHLTIYVVASLFMGFSIFLALPLINEDTPEISEMPQLFCDTPKDIGQIYQEYLKLNHDYNTRIMLNHSKLFFEFQPRVIILYNEIRAFHDMNLINNFNNIDYLAAYNFLFKLQDLYTWYLDT
uniref:Uncharacterized protein n=1 Tax=Dactylella sp. TaxID=1814903 RepID=A0A482DQQ5_9PEZI|nr:hypothetical protein [Dactylella sp.]